MQIHQQAWEHDDRWQRTEYRTDEGEVLAVEYQLADPSSVSTPSSGRPSTASTWRAVQIGAVLISILVFVGVGLVVWVGVGSIG